MTEEKERFRERVNEIGSKEGKVAVAIEVELPSSSFQPPIAFGRSAPRYFNHKLTPRLDFSVINVRFTIDERMDHSLGVFGGVSFIMSSRCLCLNFHGRLFMTSKPSKL